LEHQALIYDGKILQDDEKVFDIAQERKEKEMAKRMSHVFCMEVVLVTDKGVISAIKFHSQFAKSPPLPPGDVLNPPDPFSDLARFREYVTSLPLDPTLNAQWKKTDLAKFFRDAEARLRPVIKKDASLDFNRLMAIHLWTSNILYREINIAIRKEDISDSWHHFLCHFVSAIRDLPPCIGTGYRGCPSITNFQSYEKGNTICWKNINGMSTDKSQALNFRGNSGILFEVDYIFRDFRGTQARKKLCSYLILTSGW
jgi:hypothetical protein